MGFGVGQLYSGEIFSAGGESEDRRARRQPESRVSRAHRKAGLDGSGDKKEAVEETRHLHDQGRLSRSSARLLEARLRNDDLIGNVKRCAQLDWEFYTVDLPDRSIGRIGA